MRLFLVRHGEANPESIDPARSLTDKGVEDSVTIGKFLSSLRVKPACIFTSEKTRAVKTAEIIAGLLEFGEERIVVSGELSPNAPTESIVTFLSSHGTWEEAVIVGHLPSIGTLAGYLISPVEGVPVSLAFETCGLAIFEGDDLRKPGDFALKTLIEPSLI